MILLIEKNNVLIRYDIEANEQPEEFLMDRVPTLYVVHPNNKTAPVKLKKNWNFDFLTKISIFLRSNLIQKKSF